MLDENLRGNYLIEWRKGLWKQVRQKEDAIWKIASFYVAAVVLLAGFVKISDTSGQFELTSTVILVLCIGNALVSIWALAIIVDANFWLQRNLIFVGNIERELLAPADFGTLLPKAYADFSNYKYSKSYNLHLVGFYVVFLVTLLLVGSALIPTFSLPTPLTDAEFLLVGVYAFLFSYGVYFLLKVDENRINEFLWVKMNAVGKDGESFSPETRTLKFNKARASSPIMRWSILVGSLGGSLFLYAAFKNQNFLNQDPLIWHVLISLVIPVIGIFGLILIIVLGNVRPTKWFNQEMLTKTSTRVTNFLSRYLAAVLQASGLIWGIFLLIRVVQEFN